MQDEILSSIHWGDLPKVRETGLGLNLGCSSARQSKKYQHRKCLNLTQFCFNRQNKATQFALKLSNNIGNVTAVWSTPFDKGPVFMAGCFLPPHQTGLSHELKGRFHMLRMHPNKDWDRWRESHWEEEQSLCHLSPKDKRNKVSFEAYSLEGDLGEG